MHRYLTKSGISIGTVAGVLLYILASTVWAQNLSANDAVKLRPAVAPPPPMVKITHGGIYRLTKNLIIEDQDRDGIDIVVGDVTLDLNGFTISGPAVCTGNPPSCIGGDGVGVYISGTSTGSVTIMNGTIRGMGAWAIYGDPTLLLMRSDRVNAVGNGNGITFSNGTVSNCEVMLNAGTGIQGQVLLITGNSVSYNATGINGGGNSGYSNNVLMSNTTNVNGAIQMGTNLCNGALCP